LKVWAFDVLTLFLTQNIAIKILHHNWGVGTKKSGVVRSFSFLGTLVASDNFNGNVLAQKLKKKAKDRTFKQGLGCEFLVGVSGQTWTCTQATQPRYPHGYDMP